MTLKQKLFLKKLPENNYNVLKTAKEVGYKESYANSRIYDTVRNCKKLKEYFDEDYIKREYKKTLKVAAKEKDLTNKLRALEGMARIKSLFNDKTTIDNKNPDKIVITYGNNKSSSNNLAPLDDKLT